MDVSAELVESVFFDLRLSLAVPNLREDGLGKGEGWSMPDWEAFEAVGDVGLEVREELLEVGTIQGRRPRVQVQTMCLLVQPYFDKVRTVIEQIP